MERGKDYSSEPPFGTGNGIDPLIGGGGGGAAGEDVSTAFPPRRRGPNVSQNPFARTTTGELRLNQNDSKNYSEVAKSTRPTHMQDGINMSNEGMRWNVTRNHNVYGGGEGGATREVVFPSPPPKRRRPNVSQNPFGRSTNPYSEVGTKAPQTHHSTMQDDMSINNEGMWLNESRDNMEAIRGRGRGRGSKNSNRGRRGRGKSPSPPKRRTRTEFKEEEHVQYEDHHQENEMFKDYTADDYEEDVVVGKQEDEEEWKSSSQDLEEEEWKSSSQDLEEMSDVDLMTEWLTMSGFAKYAPLFQYHHVDAKVRAPLTLDELRDMGITNVGERRKIHDLINLELARQRPG